MCNNPVQHIYTLFITWSDIHSVILILAYLEYYTDTICIILYYILIWLYFGWFFGLVYIFRAYYIIFIIMCISFMFWNYLYVLLMSFLLREIMKTKMTTWMTTEWLQLPCWNLRCVDLQQLMNMQVKIHSILKVAGSCNHL